MTSRLWCCQFETGVLILDLYTGIFGMETKTISNGGSTIRHGAYVVFVDRSRMRKFPFAIRSYDCIPFAKYSNRADAYKGKSFVLAFFTRFEKGLWEMVL
jgi:hypothetical protein